MQKRGEHFAVKHPSFELRYRDRDYPAQLRELEDDAPKCIYGYGDYSLLSENLIAIVGARQASPYGLAASQMLAQVAVSAGFHVISGGAVGCDQAAGRQCLDSGGKHVVVLGSGADVCYPKSAGPFFREVLDTGGCIISEQKWKTQPLRWTFPKRNRIIAALSKALVLSEAGLPSGSTSGAEAALNLGRLVAAVPGAIFSSSSRGCNKLIEDGALPIWDREAFALLLSTELGSLALVNKAASCLQEDRLAISEPIMRALVASPCTPTELAQWNAVEISEVLRMLMAYETEGLVVKLRDGRYSPTSKYLLSIET